MRGQQPTRAEWNAWKQTVSGKFFEDFLATWIDALIAKFLSGDLVEGNSMEDIARRNIEFQTKAAIFKELYDLTYDDICSMLELNPLEDKEE